MKKRKPYETRKHEQRVEKKARCQVQPQIGMDFSLPTLLSIPERDVVERFLFQRDVKDVTWSREKLKEVCEKMIIKAHSLPPMIQTILLMAEHESLLFNHFLFLSLFPGNGFLARLVCLSKHVNMDKLTLFCPQLERFKEIYESNIYPLGLERFQTEKDSERTSTLLAGFFEETRKFVLACRTCYASL